MKTLLLIAFMAVSANAQLVPIRDVNAELLMAPVTAAIDITPQTESIKAIDMAAPLADARIGLAWDMKGEQLGVAYVPVVYIVGNRSGREYATLNLGASDKLDTGKVGYLVSFGFRMDTIFAKLGETKFAKKFLRFAVLPPMQISPCFITGDFKKFVPMLSISTKFGGR